MNDVKRIIIAGCRSWDFKQAGEVVDRMIAKYGQQGFMIVHMKVDTGVDAAFEKAASERGVLTHVVHYEDSILTLGADLCLCVHRSVAKSRRTRIIVED